MAKKQVYDLSVIPNHRLREALKDLWYRKMNEVDKNGKNT